MELYFQICRRHSIQWTTASYSTSVGPLLFLVYINDLPSITCNRCNVSLYADDTVLYCYASDVNDLERNLNEDLLKLAIWLKENKLTLNLNKTRSMIIGSDRKLCNLSSMSVSVSTILNASNFKYLGVTITANFTWSEHIDRISAKVYQRLGLLRRIKHLLPFNARILFYNSLVLPIFDYAYVMFR